MNLLEPKDYEYSGFHSVVIITMSFSLYWTA
jgi:hypothetical protein